MPFHNGSSAAIHYEQTGSGPDIVWVSGGGTLGRDWQRFQTPHFDPRFRSTVFDNRGIGSTTCDAELPWPISDFAHDLAELVEGVCDGPVSFIGSSLGSAIVQEVAIEYPALVKCAVVMGTGAWSTGWGWDYQEAEIEFRRRGGNLVATTYRPTSEALRPQGATPGRPGISALRLRQVDVVTGDEMERLRALVRDESSSGDTTRLDLFDRHFETGEVRGYRHEMDPHDFQDFLLNVRQGKQSCDFLVVTMHSHEIGRDGYPELPSPFLKQLAKAAIDAGADTVGVSGIHHVGPVDLYRDRPIFYGLGNFIWSDLQDFLPSELLDLNRDLLNDAFENPQRATAADFNGVVNAGHFAQDEVFETVLPIVRFDGDRLVEVALHAIDLGHGDPLTLSGVPRLAGPEQADRILRRVRDASAAFGCDHAIEIKNGVGFLRTGQR